MTKPTPHGQVPEAPYLQLAYLLASGQHLVSAERKEAAAAIRDLHAENEALRTAHVQNPAAIEQVAGDVSKNGVELNMSTQQPVAQQGAADGFFLLLPQRPKPEAPAGTAGLDWDAYSGAQMLAFGRDCSDAAIAALRTQQPAPATQQAGDVVAYLDVGASGYLDLGAALSEDALQQLPKGRHALVIAGTYGIDGYVAAPQPSPTTKPAPQPAPAPLSVQDEDAAMYRWLRAQHEDDSGELRCCVYAPNDMLECLVPVGDMPGELDAFIRAALAAQGGK